MVVSSKSVQWNPQNIALQTRQVTKFFYQKSIIGAIGGRGPSSEVLNMITYISGTAGRICTGQRPLCSL